MPFACFPIDRRDRYRKSWRCETERRLIRVNAKSSSLLILFLPSPRSSSYSSFFFLFSFFACSFRRSSIEPLVMRTREGRRWGKLRKKERKREREMVWKMVATDVEVTTSVCQRRLTIRIFRHFYRSNVPVLLLLLLLLLFLLTSKPSSKLYISFNSVEGFLKQARCSVIMI